MSVEKVNLIPPARATRARVQQRARMWSVASAGYAALAVGACLTMASEPGAGSRSDLVRLERSLGAKQADLKAARAQMVDLQRRLDAAECVTRHPDWSVLLRMLASLRGSEVMLGAVALDPVVAASAEPARPGGKARGTPAREAYTLHVEGSARAQLGVADFAQALQDSGVFASVRLVDSKAEVDAGVAVVRFHLVCELGDRPPASGREQP